MITGQLALLAEPADEPFESNHQTGYALKGDETQISLNDLQTPRLVRIHH